MPVQIQQRGLRAGVQGLGTQVEVCSGRVVGEAEDIGGVDDLRVRASVPCLVERGLPVLLIVDPRDHVGLHRRDRIGDAELHA